MIFSPAAAAYIFILTSWSKELLMYPEPHDHLGLTEKPDELVYSASHTFNITGKMELTDFEILMGNFSGPAGSLSVLLLVISAVMLIFRGDISAGAFLGSVSGTAALALISPVCESRVDSVGYSIVSNMVLFASVYIIADKRIAPQRNFYAFFYGFFIAACAYVIVLTTAKENAIIMVSVLFTPVALGLKNLEKRIDKAIDQEKNEAAELLAAKEQKGGADI
jgi:Na+-translocating ferredoxin:NAD+ oxidoreductase RnfD subunit